VGQGCRWCFFNLSFRCENLSLTQVTETQAFAALPVNAD